MIRQVTHHHLPCTCVLSYCEAHSVFSRQSRYGFSNIGAILAVQNCDSDQANMCWCVPWSAFSLVGAIDRIGWGSFFDDGSRRSSVKLVQKIQKYDCFIEGCYDTPILCCTSIWFSWIILLSNQTISLHPLFTWWPLPQITANLNGGTRNGYLPKIQFRW